MTIEKQLKDLTLYTEGQLSQLCLENNWKGSGTETNPLLIPTEEGLPQKFALVKSMLFIKILNCNFEHIILYQCQNVSIESSSFIMLGFARSYKNYIVNSTISKFHLSFSDYNQIKKCTIGKTSNIFSDDNVIEDCTLSRKALKHLQENALASESY